MEKETFSELYAQYQILNNCLSTSYHARDKAAMAASADKNDIQSQAMLQKAQFDIEQLSEPVTNLWTQLLLSLEKKHGFKRLKNPLYALKEKQIRDVSLKISK